VGDPLAGARRSGPARPDSSPNGPDVRGLFIDDGRLSFREDLPRPTAGPGESRVRVLRAGICATDLALERGYMGFRGVPGHEFVGVALDGPHAGRRVVGEINAACGECATCRAGHGRHCPRRDVLGILRRPGAFAEELSLPDGNLHPVPEAVTSDEATFAEPVAAAFELAAELDLSAFERALVIGDGRLGLLCAQVLRAAGLPVELAGRHPERLRWLNADRTPIGHLPPEAAVPGGERRWDLVVEATGDPSVLATSLALVRPRGTVVLKTTAERAVELDLAPLVVDEITLVGSRCGPFEPALLALADGSVTVAPMIEDRFPLEAGAEAFRRAAAGGVLKILIDVCEP